MKFKELSAMKTPELEEKLRQARLELMKANAQVATGSTSKNSGNVRQIKRTVAKIKSLIGKSQKEDKKE